MADRGNVEFKTIDTKSRFKELLANSEIKDNWLVLIEETKEIFAFGALYSRSHQFVTKEQYKALDEAGLVDPDVIYYIP